jgi:hypothetical protein
MPHATREGGTTRLPSLFTRHFACHGRMSRCSISTGVTTRSCPAVIEVERYRVVCQRVDRSRRTTGRTLKIELTHSDQISHVILGHTGDIVSPLIMSSQPVGRFQVFNGDVLQEDAELEAGLATGTFGGEVEVFEATAEVDLTAGRTDFEDAEGGRGAFEEMAEGGDEVEVEHDPGG